MKTENAVLMEQSRETLRGKWGMAVGATAIYILMTLGIRAIRDFGPIASLLISGAMSYGLAVFILSLSRKKDAKISQLFDGFNHFILCLKTYLLVILFTVLWTLLLIIPGIIAGISYSQTFYILADDNSLSAREAIRRSKKMMYGYKWKYFCLMFRFFGWFLLSILTLGIGFLWLVPYVQVSTAKFYDDISDRNKESSPVPQV